MAVLYQSILRSVPTFGGAPEHDWLDATATALSLQADGALAELARRDLLGYDPLTATITYVYPFSATPTPHRVAVGGHRPVYAMCAVDALGVPFMLEQDASITSADPVHVRAHAGRHPGWAGGWDPPSVVVVACQGRAEGTAAQQCCPHINFFRSPADAAAYVAAHPGQQGRVLS